MFDTKTHDLLCLFATMIVADKKIYAVEIEAFADCVIDFFAKTDLGEAPSQAQLLDWFETNRDDVRSKVKQDGFETWFDKLMHEVSEVYSIRAVIEAMQKIARADNEVHISEKALLVLVDRYWTRAA